ncbi:MAG: acyl-CoA dehydrogenase family protein, partial [Nannocystaceae bacterium]|nr:acyl-CoA dehydrogenase family protein [Nannocystaceae bacterium]
MGNYLSDNEDLLYYFDKGIDWQALFEVTERDPLDEDAPADVGQAVEVYRDIAEMVGKFCADEIAPHAAEIDRVGVHLGEDGEAVTPKRMQQIFAQIKALDLHWLTIPRELGGMNCPMLLYFINSEVMARADVSVMAHHGFHGGMAMAMLIFSVREGTTKIENNRIVETRFRKELEEIARGEAWG